MSYSLRILIAALLLLSTTPASSKVLALPSPTPVAHPSTTRTSPNVGLGETTLRGPGSMILAQSSTTVSPPNAPAAGGWAWWWLALPAAAGAGALGWAATRRGSATTADAPMDGIAAQRVSESPAPPHPPEPLTLTSADRPLMEAELPEATPLEAIPLPMDRPVGQVIPEPEPDPWFNADPEPTSESAPPTVVLAPEIPEESTPESSTTSPEPVMGSAAGATGLAMGVAATVASTEDQATIEASKFNVVGQPTAGTLDLSTVDDGLPPLPDGYGASRIVLMPRDPQWAYVYWDIPNGHREDLRRQGGERLALRLYDVTNISRDHQAPHGMQQCDCDELARDWYLQIPVSDRDYQAEIGYLASDGRWLMLARSNAIRVPPIYPSDWSEDHFMTVTWGEALQGKTLMALGEPVRPMGGLHEQMYALSQSGEADRVAGSVYGSMPHVPGSVPHIPGSISHVAGSISHVAGSLAPYSSAVSSYAWASGALPTLSGVGLNVSGLNMSGLSGLTLSGVGFSASMPPARPRQFWLVADAELIVYGATEPDATLTVAGQPVSLSPEGHFRIQTAFPDGNIDYPIMAVAADGEQNRSIHMTFDRQTPSRQTNTKAEAQEEWFDD